MYSWTAMQAFMTCNRKFELSQIENIERMPSEKNEARLLGVCLHAGMAANLLSQQHPLEHRVKIAIEAAEKALKLETVPNKLIKGLDGKPTIDTIYYLMLEGIHQQLPRLLEYIIPQIDLERYYVPLAGAILAEGVWSKCDNCAGSGMVAGGNPSCTKCYGLGHDKTYMRTCSCYGEYVCSSCNGKGHSANKKMQRMVEWKFEFENFTGYIDALLYDRQTGDFVLVDWKFRSKFTHDETAALDGQLPFYAACLNAMGANITATVMYQIRTAIPKPAAINQNGQPSIAAQDTTWEYWLKTLPLDLRRRLDLDEWRLKLENKLKSERDYINPVEALVTEKSSELALDNARMTARMMEAAKRIYQDGYALPATLNDNACKWCDFLRLCRSPLKYGGDATAIIDEEYQQRRGRN